MEMKTFGVWLPHNLSALIAFSSLPGSIKACNEEHCPYHTHMTTFIAVTPGQTLLASVLFALQNIPRLCSTDIQCPVIDILQTKKIF